MLTNSFSAAATKFLNYCSKFGNSKELQVIDLSGVLSVLKHIKIDEQFAIAGLTPGFSGLGGSLMLTVCLRLQEYPENLLFESLSHCREMNPYCRV